MQTKILSLVALVFMAMPAMATSLDQRTQATIDADNTTDRRLGATTRTNGSITTAGENARAAAAANTTVAAPVNATTKAAINGDIVENSAAADAAGGNVAVIPGANVTTGVTTAGELNNVPNSVPNTARVGNGIDIGSGAALGSTANVGVGNTGIGVNTGVGLTGRGVTSNTAVGKK